jgi:hypothetical protein
MLLQKRSQKEDGSSKICSDEGAIVGCLFLPKLDVSLAMHGYYVRGCGHFSHVYELMCPNY